MVDGRWWCTPGGGYGGASQVFTSTSSRQPPQNIARSLPGRGGRGGLRFEFTLEALQLQRIENCFSDFKIRQSGMGSVGWEVRALELIRSLEL